MEVRRVAAAATRTTIVDAREPDGWRACARRPIASRRIGRCSASGRSGSRSGKAAPVLKTLGFSAENVDGGMRAEANARLPMEGAEPAPRVA